MMDELELLKKDWQKKERNLPKLTYDEIYQMIWKKSSSLVKWIFYISIAEFIFWIVLGFLPIDTDEYSGEYAKLFTTVENGLELLSYAIIVFFMFKFYQNYKSINNSDSVKGLMHRIIKTRKTVMQYVWFNLVLFGVMSIVVLIEAYIGGGLGEMISDATKGKAVLIIAILVLGIVLIITLLWLFYKLLYGILLRRLGDNYKELKKLEV